MLIAKITDSDFFGGEPQYIEDNVGYNVRGVLTDGKGNVLLMKIENSDYYKLPGGGIEITETPQQAVIREISEETGYDAEITSFLGWIEEHKLKRKFCMVSHCYVAKTVSGEQNDNAVKQVGERLGLVPVWMKYATAISTLQKLSGQCEEYQMSFVLRRERLILESAKEFVKVTRQRTSKKKTEKEPDKEQNSVS